MRLEQESDTAAQDEEEQVAGGLALAGIVFHFLCSRFAYAGTHLVAASPCRTATGGLTECLGLFTLLVALAGFLAGMYAGIREASIYPAVGGVVVFVSFGFIALCLLNPHTCLNLQFDEESETTAGETALSFCIVILRLLLLAVPTVATLTAAGGTIASLWAFIKLIGTSADEPYALFPVIELGTTATGCLVVAGTLPLLIYLYYLLGVLSVELSRAIFEIARNTKNPKT